MRQPITPTNRQLSLLVRLEPETSNNQLDLSAKQRRELVRNLAELLLQAAKPREAASEELSDE